MPWIEMSFAILNCVWPLWFRNNCYPSRNIFNFSYRVQVSVCIIIYSCEQSLRCRNMGVTQSAVVLSAVGLSAHNVTFSLWGELFPHSLCDWNETWRMSYTWSVDVWHNFQAHCFMHFRVICLLCFENNGTGTFSPILWPSSWFQYWNMVIFNYVSLFKKKTFRIFQAWKLSNSDC